MKSPYDYQIGNLVYGFNKTTRKQELLYIYSIEEFGEDSNPHLFIRARNLNNSYIDSYLAKELSSIYLTSKILEVNGFVAGANEKNALVNILNLNDGYSIELNPLEDGFDVSVFHNKLPVLINKRVLYVHQLQNIFTFLDLEVPLKVDSKESETNS